MITNNNRKIYSQPELSGAWYHLNHKTMVPDKLKSGGGGGAHDHYSPVPWYHKNMVPEKMKSGEGCSLANQTIAWYHKIMVRDNVKSKGVINRE